jgi:hypothetical protein
VARLLMSPSATVVVCVHCFCMCVQAGAGGEAGAGAPAAHLTGNFDAAADIETELSQLGIRARILQAKRAVSPMTLTCILPM